MVNANGIPRGSSPSDLAQRVRDLERTVERLTSSRNYVSVGNIVEGGTINESVGTELTKTVQKGIVIDGGNLGAGALDGQRMVGAIIETNDAANRGVKIDDTGLRGYDADGNRFMKADEAGLEMTGSISTKGKTAEATPRDITVRLTTVSRDSVGGAVVNNPSLVFDDGSNLNDWSASPGVYSPDGSALAIVGRNSTLTGKGRFELGPAKASINSGEIVVGSWDVWETSRIVLQGRDITVGAPADLFHSLPATVNLVGNVKVNGSPIMKTVIPNIPAGSQQIELIANGSAMTTSLGEFTINFPVDTFPNACIAIFIVPNSGGGTIPVVNGTGALTKTSCRAVQPGNGNKSITYSYRAIGY